MSLREEALGGARYLLAREAIGVLVRLGGVMVLTALIGPGQYGLFAGPFLVVQFCAVLATFGTDVFLIRRAGHVEEAWYHQAFSFLLVSGTALALAGILAADSFADVIDDPRVIAPLQVLLLSIPINILWIPARAVLERRFDYRRLAVSELGADALQYVVAIGLAFSGAGVWAAVHGFLARQAYMLVSSYILARYWPRWRWDRRMLGELLRYGGGISGSTLAVRARDLVLAVVVGRYLGATGVGIAALTVRLVETAAFVNRAANRVTVVALSRIQDQPGRLRNAVEEGTSLRVLAAGPVLVVLCLAGDGLLPALLGPRWEAVGDLLPFVALNTLIGTLLATQGSALVALGRRWSMFLANAAVLVVYATAAVLLVPTLGLPGLGLAMVVSQVASWVRNLELRSSHGVRYTRAIPWFAATLPLLFAGHYPWWGVVLAVLPGLAVALSRRHRAALMAHAHVLQRTSS